MHVPKQHSVTVWVTVLTSETVMTVSGLRGAAKGGVRGPCGAAKVLCVAVEVASVEFEKVVAPEELEVFIIV